MKYKYKKISVWIQCAGALLICAFLTALSFALLPDDNGFHWKIATGTLGVCSVTFARFTPEFYRRYIELCDSYVHFHSFRFKDVTMKKAASFNVMYENILSMDAKRLPIIGVYAVIFKAKSLPKELTVSFFYHDYKELFKSLCESVSQANPNAYIDDRILEAIGVTKNEEA